MKRLLALVLVGGALLLGGCGRQHVAAPAGASTGDRPATTAPAAKDGAAGSGTTAASSTSGASASSSSGDDVDSLLSDVDKQLHNDAQPSQDQD